MSGIKIIKRVKSSKSHIKEKQDMIRVCLRTSTTPKRERKEPSRVVVVCNIKATNMQAQSETLSREKFSRQYTIYIYGCYSRQGANGLTSCIFRVSSTTPLDGCCETLFLMHCWNEVELMNFHNELYLLSTLYSHKQQHKQRSKKLLIASIVMCVTRSLTKWLKLSRRLE